MTVPGMPPYGARVPTEDPLRSDDAPTSDAAGAAPWERWVAVAVVVTAAVTVAGTTVARATAWVPTTDWALIEWQVRHVGDQLPLLGAPSSVGFHHPGPAIYLVLAPLYHLLGADPRALSIATGGLAAAAVIGIGATAWRRGGLVPTAAATAVALWLAGSLPAGTLLDPWNPWVAVLPFAWLLVLVWSVLDDDRWALPLAALVASFVVQAHVGYAIPVTALAALVAAHLLTHRRATSEPPRAGIATSGAGRGPLIAVATIAVVVAVWALPAWQQVTGDDGNVARLWTYATDGSAGDRPALGDSVGLVATELGWPGPWLTGHEPIENIGAQTLPSPWWRLVVAAGALGLAAVAARPDRSARRLVATAAVASASTAVAVLLVEEGRAFPYALRLTWPASAAIGLAVIIAGASRLTRHTPAARTPLAGGVVALALMAAVRLVVVSGDAIVPVDRPDQRDHERACLAQLLPDVRAAAGEGPAHVTQVEWWPAMSGPIVNELDRAGVAVAVDERLGFHLQQPGRPATDDEVQLIVVDDPFLAEWEQRDDVVEIARCQRLTDAEQAELAELEARADRNALDELRRFDLTRLAAEVAVFEQRS